MIGRVLAAGLLTFAAAAQTPPAFRSNLDLVTIPCTVLDVNGNPVTDLAPEEFHVFDNNVRRTVQSLWHDADQPVTLGIIIDASESQHDLIEEHRHTVLAVLEQILRPGDRAFVISVSEYIRVWADLSSKIEDLRKQMALDPAEPLGAPCPQCGGSQLWNAVYETARVKLRPLTGNKALLILTDGFDTGSTHTWRQAADEVARAEAAVYAVQYQIGLGGRFAPDLTRLLEESGGAWFGAPAGNYANIVARLETDLRHRYVLAIHPDMTGGNARHELRVEVTRPDLKVRARKAYVQVGR